VPLLDPALSWWSFPLVIVDFETTGTDPAECAPVSVAAIRLEQGVERGHFYSLVRPGIAIPPEASAIHGITDDDVREAPYLDALAPELCTLAHGAVPCGYNGATFDAVILHRYIKGSDCPLFDPGQEWIDPLVMIRSIDRYVKGSGRHKLSTTCARWGVPFAEGAAHNALEDVRGVGRLLRELVRLDKVRTRTSLRRMLEYIAIKRAEQDARFEAYLARLAAKEAQTSLDLTPPPEGDACL
jgi:DNA polymerase-3 subunit epsilon